MRHDGRALVVTDDADTRDYWATWLQLAGYDTGTCPGPGGATDCPQLKGVRCTLREGAAIAVVDLDCDEDALACAKVTPDGGTVFIRRSARSLTGRRELLRAVEDASRHVKDLRGAPHEHEPVPAFDLD